MGETGKRIKYFREKHNLTQIELAKKLEIDNTVLSKIEKGRRSIEDSLLIKLADIFDLSTDALLGRDITNNKSPDNLYFFDMKGLTEEEIEDIKNHINYVKWKSQQDKDKNRNE